MPDTDFNITQSWSDLITERKSRRDAYDDLIDFINNRSKFLKDKGNEFFALLAEFRKYIILPTVKNELSPAPAPVIPTDFNEEQAEKPRGSRITIGIAGIILDGIVIVGLIFFGIYHLLQINAVVVGLFSALGFIFIPGIASMISSRLLGREIKKQEDIDTIFDDMIKEYRQGLFVPRVVLEENKEEAKKLGARIARGPYGDDLATDPVTQAQMILAAKYTRQLGSIYNIAEREHLKMYRFVLGLSGQVSGAAAGQGLRTAVRS